jgi:hypothetical protein
MQPGIARHLILSDNLVLEPMDEGQAKAIIRRREKALASLRLT